MNAINLQIAAGTIMLVTLSAIHIFSRPELTQAQWLRTMGGWYIGAVVMIFFGFWWRERQK